MTIVLREITREAADAILAGERPGGVRVADDYPTEFSAGVAQCVGAEGQFGPFFLHRAEDDLVIGEIGGAFVDEEGTIEIGYAVVESQWNRGYATAAVEALVTRRADPEVRRIVAHTPLERPESGRVLEKAGFGMVREMDDADEAGNVVRVKEWELTALASGSAQATPRSGVRGAQWARLHRRLQRRRRPDGDTRPGRRRERLRDARRLTARFGPRTLRRLRVRAAA